MSSFSVVGLGNISKRHISNLRKLHPNGEILVVSSSGKNKVLPEKANKLVDLNYLIEIKPKYVIIASPANEHVNIAENLLESGIDVLIEKPLSDNSRKCSSLVELERKLTERKACVAYCLRFHPALIELRRCLAKKEIGELITIRSFVGSYLPDWRKGKNYKKSVSANISLGGGVLLELSHEIDYLFWLFGDLKLKSSFLRSSNELSLEVEDIADLNFIDKNNITISVHMNFTQKFPQRYCEVIGTRGIITCDLLENKITFKNLEGSEILYHSANFDTNQMYIDMLREFEQCTLVSKTNLASLTSSLKINKIIDLAKEINEIR